MAFTGLDSLKTKIDYDLDISNAQSYKNTQAYIDYKNDKYNKVRETLLLDISQKILNYFNEDNQNLVNTDKTMKVNVSKLNAQDLLDLTNALENKSYTVINDNNILCISS